MLDKDRNALVAMEGKKELCLLPAMGNRHGLITGATGTGKTVTLQSMAETFSALGVPVFMADVKGDLSGLAKAGGTGKAAERAAQLGLRELGYAPKAFPVCFWDVFGKMGHPMRTTVSEMGPLLLSRLLNLNEVQAGVLQLAFRIADDAGLLLLDMKDLRSMVQYVGDERDAFKTSYGQISTASVGAIQRALLRLEEEGGDVFFGEPALDINDLLQTDAEGRGVINILEAESLMNAPGLYACVLLWLLSELYENLPEAGDRDKPRLVFFFDEAHLLFDGISPALLQKIEQVTRLIRSRGVGIYFVSQNPSDIPDSVLGQLGNRVQHALRAFTPKEQKAVRAAAQAFRANPAFATEEAIGELGVGEALVSFLDAKGAPTMVERALIVPPESQVGPVTPEERAAVMRRSLVAGVYDKPVDRESAYEKLMARAQEKQAAEAAEARRAEMAKAAQVAERERKQQEAALRRAETEARRRETAERKARMDAGAVDIGDLLGSVVRQTTRQVGNTVGREIGKTLLRGVLGGLFGGRR
ncbi:MAG: DUF853 family protein [Desulfovibrio sp.]|nr:DUF853 family protein [Desulfovibrio sp.]